MCLQTWKSLFCLLQMKKLKLKSPVLTLWRVESTQHVCHWCFPGEVLVPPTVVTSSSTGNSSRAWNIPTFCFLKTCLLGKEKRSPIMQTSQPWQSAEPEKALITNYADGQKEFVLCVSGLSSLSDWNNNPEGCNDRTPTPHSLEDLWFLGL